MSGDYFVLERTDIPQKRAFLKMYIGGNMQFTENVEEAAMFCEDAAMMMVMNAANNGTWWLWPTPVRREVRFVLNGKEV